ncbi:MAG: hypothetical protein KatS3mg087_0646 [Patescibacteria group bacterium]|nr:MAG: hypothetical protein KatS3mg087_0646 [Patescibacteria group bacterium]
MGRKELKTIIVCEFSPSNAIVNAFDWLINYNVLTIFIWFNWIKYLVESLVKMPSNAGTFWAMVHLKRRCTMSILSAEVAPVPIGDLVISGLMDEEGEYYVGFPQISDQFQLPHKNLGRTVKSLLGNDVSVLRIRVKNAQNRNYYNALSLLDFEKLVAKLDRAGNKPAQIFRDALVGLSLHQLFSDAFNVELTKGDRQQFIKDRILDQVTCPYQSLYKKELCNKGFKWYGAQFYWKYFYYWMTPLHKTYANLLRTRLFYAR